jgi:hypothetical protein
MHLIQLDDAADLTGYSAVVADLIPKVRQVINQEPCLAGYIGASTEPSSKYAKKRRDQRVGNSELYQELSQYYPPPGPGLLWTKSKLLSKGKHGGNQCRLGRWIKPHFY